MIEGEGLERHVKRKNARGSPTSLEAQHNESARGPGMIIMLMRLCCFVKHIVGGALLVIVLLCTSTAALGH